MTTIADNFDRADSGTLGTASGGFSWTSVSDVCGIVSNQASHAPSATANHNRAETDLASSDHYSEISVVTIDTSINQQARLLCRYDSAADTAYVFIVRADASQYRLFKVVAGVLTQLGSTVSEALPARPFTARLTVSGSTLTGSIGGVDKVTTTDSAITGNTRTGFGASCTAGANVAMDSFTASDLAAASAPWAHRFARVIGPGAQAG